MTLNEFLDARIAEDEQTAKAAAAMTTGQPVSGGDWSVTEVPFEGISVWDPQPDLPGHTDARTEHIERHDPAQVLRQCAAIREAIQIIRETHGSAVNVGLVDIETDTEMALQAIAAIWSDHPDYNPRWKL